MPHVEQELPTTPEHLSSHWVFSGGPVLSLHCKKMNIKDKVIKSLSKILTQITEIGEKIKAI
jgi:hypothetical protein